MESDIATATLIVLLRESATWWTPLVPDAMRFAEALVDWVSLPRIEPSLFKPGVVPGGKDIVPLDWPIMAARVDFSTGVDLRRIPSTIGVLAEAMIPAGWSVKWHR
jgi:hypothetical protein